MPGMEITAPERTDTNSGFSVLAGYFLQLSDLFINGINQVLCNGLAFFIVPVARFGSDRKAKRYRQTDSGHFRQVGTLSSEKTSHVL